MSKKILKQVFTLLFITWLTPVFSQITFENNYPYSGTYTHLKYSGDKFFVMDVVSKQCRIYNTDHTIWKTVSLIVPANHTLYDIRYVSENLFTNDNSLSLAYTYYYLDLTNYYYTYYSKIIKENGVELLSLTGCMYLSVHQIDETDTKLLAYIYDYTVTPYTVQTRVYDLPGQLASSSEEKPGGTSWITSSLSPNPSKGFVTIKYALPDDTGKGEVIIIDLLGNIVKSQILTKNSGQVTINTSGLPKGNYLFYIKAEHYLSKTEKLIIQ